LGNLVDDRLARIQKMQADAKQWTEGLITGYKNAVKNIKAEGKTVDFDEAKRIFHNTVWIEKDEFIANVAVSTGLRIQVLNGYFDLLVKSGRFQMNPNNNNKFRSDNEAYDAWDAMEKEYGIKDT